MSHQKERKGQQKIVTLSFGFGLGELVLGLAEFLPEALDLGNGFNLGLAALHVSSGEGSLLIDLVSGEGDTVQVVALGELLSHLQVTADQGLAKGLLEGLLQFRVKAHPLESREGIMGVWVGHLLVLDPVEGHEGHPAGLGLAEVLNQAGGHIVVINHHLEQAGPCGGLDGGPVGGVHLKKIIEGAMNTGKLGLVHQGADGVDAAADLLGDRAVQGILLLTEVLAQALDGLLQLILLSPQFPMRWGKRKNSW